MKKCKVTEPLITAYVYGELPPEKIKEVSGHLAGCNHCRLKEDSLIRTLSLVRSVKLKEPPKNLFDDYAGEIRERLGQKESYGRVPRGIKIPDFLAMFRPSFYPQFVPALAVISALIFIFALVKYPMIREVNLINQDIALLENMGEDVQRTIGTDLNREIEDADLATLARIEEDRNI